MGLKKNHKAFDDAILDLHPELKDFLKPTDQYPELEYILKHRSANLPPGSLNTKVIICEGEVIERVFKTPMGHVIYLFSKPSNVILDRIS